MQTIISKTAVIKQHMKGMHPASINEIGAILQLIKEYAQHLSILASVDEELIMSTIAMVESVQTAYSMYVV